MARCVENAPAPPTGSGSLAGSASVLLRTKSSTVCGGYQDLCFTRDAALVYLRGGEAPERWPCPNAEDLKAAPRRHEYAAAAALRRPEARVASGPRGARIAE